jgi:hypothetical protein
MISFYGQTQNINVSSGNVFDGEPYLAIDPSNDQHLVAAWMGFQVGQGIVIKTKYSNDGGVTWSNVNELPHIAGAIGSADVSLEYDSNGNLFMCYIDYDNQNFTQGDVLVRKSTDGGATWGNPVSAISISDCPNQLCVDRPWMAIDKSGGVNNGAIYVTSINANQPSFVVPPYHSYLSVSSDGGASFSAPRFVDTTNYMVGSIAQAGTSPVVGPDGTFHAIYPSYDVSQSPFAHIYLASSTTLGADLTHVNAYTVLIAGTSDPYAKKAGHLMSDPSEPQHLALLLLGDQSGDGDVFFMETYNAVNWSTPVRINDDPIGNGKLQDLIWGEFNETGDLAICWRDRRNAAGSGYQTETEIYGVVRYNDSTDFEPNFPVSSAQAPHNAILEGSGNDFMNVRFVGDTIYAVWGDVRSGSLNIYLNKTSVLTGISSIQTIHSDDNLLSIYPNPATDFFTIKDFAQLENCTLLDTEGRFVQAIDSESTSVENLQSGTYVVRFRSSGKTFAQTIVIHH